MGAKAHSWVGFVGFARETHAPISSCRLLYYRWQSMQNKIMHNTGSKIVLKYFRELKIRTQVAILLFSVRALKPSCSLLWSCELFPPLPAPRRRHSCVGCQVEAQLPAQIAHFYTLNGQGLKNMPPFMPDCITVKRLSFRKISKA